MEEKKIKNSIMAQILGGRNFRETEAKQSYVLWGNLQSGTGYIQIETSNNRK